MLTIFIVLGFALLDVYVNEYALKKNLLKEDHMIVQINKSFRVITEVTGEFFSGVFALVGRGTDWLLSRDHSK